MRSLYVLAHAVVLATSLVVTDAAVAESIPARGPNILLIVGDDHGWPYAGFMGDEFVTTPNLDRLAAGGLTFTHAMSSASTCRPALQTLLSGLQGRTWNSQRARIERDLGATLPYRTEVSHYVTLPHQLRRQGYRSFQGGKLWEGSFEDAGFDWGSAFRLAPHPIVTVSSLVFGRINLSPMSGFLNSVGDHPFFLMLTPKLPHTPHDASAALRAPYEGFGLTEDAVAYYANITRLDDMIGRTLGALEFRGELENTLIIYVSDNGWEQAPFEEHFLGPLIGGERGKVSAYELGFRSPLIFNWPGHVPGGQVVDDLVSFEDLHATILEYANAPKPPDHSGTSLQARIEGVDVAPRSEIIGVVDRLRVRESEFRPPITLGGLVLSETGAFLRTPEWRYIEFLNRGEQELYRINQDPLEQINLASDHPDLLDGFAAQTRAWREELTVPAPWIDLMGRFVTDDDTIGSGLRLWLEGQDTSGYDVRMQVSSDTHGYFRIPNVPAGHYQLEYETMIAPTDVADADVHTETRVLDLTDYQTSPFITLHALNAQPQADPNASATGQLHIQIVNHQREGVTHLPLTIRAWRTDSQQEQRVFPGPHGSVVLDQLPAGHYIVSTEGTKRFRKTSRWVYVSQGKTRDVSIKIKEPRKKRRDRYRKKHWKKGG